MDSLTHILIGASIGLAIAQPENRRKAAWVGALACTTPDFDMLVTVTQQPLATMLIHRSFTHSLLFIPIGGLVIAGLVLLCCKSLRNSWRQILLISLLAYASHGVLDACTSYGTQLLWPFSNQRISWDIISIFDPLFLLALVLGTAISYKKKIARPALFGLSFCLIYLCGGIFQHTRAMTLQQELVKEQGAMATQCRVMPTFANLYIWNSLYIANKRVYLATIAVPLLGHGRIIFDYSLPLLVPENLPDYVKNDAYAMNELKIFQWFAQGYVAAVSYQPLTVIDLRYILKSTIPLAMWGIIITSHEQHTAIKVQHRIIIPTYLLQR